MRSPVTGVFIAFLIWCGSSMKFKPSWLSTLVLAGLATIFCLLGRWQLDRAAGKELLEAQFANAPQASAVPADEQVQPFSRLELAGQLDTKRHFLLDNQVQRGQPGVHVLTPFQDSASGRWLLVNRGWLPMVRDRSRLPEVPVMDGGITISGHLQKFPQGGIRLGDADELDSNTWPQLVTYPDLENMARALDLPLSGWVLYLSAQSAAGFDGRNWQLTSMGPDKHRGYAVQWFALAATAFIAWMVLGVIRAKETDA